MAQGAGDSDDCSSLCADLSNLVLWAHTHGAICSQIPALEVVQSAGRPGREGSFRWLCGAGHAYYWQCRRLAAPGRGQDEAAEGRRRPAPCETSPRGAAKRPRVPPSLERAKAGAAPAGSGSRAPALPPKPGGTASVGREERSPGGGPTRGAAVEPVPAAASAGEGSAGGCEVKIELGEEAHSVLSEEECTSDGRAVLAESGVEGAAAEQWLQRRGSWTVTLNQLPAPQGPGPERPPLTPACFPRFPRRGQESLDSSSTLRPSALSPSGYRSEAPSPGSAVPKERLKPWPACSAQPKAQPESPTSVAFCEADAPVRAQEQLQLSPSERGSPATDCSVEEVELLGSGQTPHPCASASDSSTQPPAASSYSALEKRQKKARSRNNSNIRYFQNWLLLHCPAERREIHELLPEELDRYLALFYSSVKKQDGRDFSAGSFHFFQLSITRYLEEHGYGYSVARGLEFSASREALKAKMQHLSEREREGEWSLLESLTEEEVGSLREKGVLSRMSPQGLLQLVLIHVVRAFGARTHSQGRSPRWGQLALRRLEGKLEFLEWKDDPDSEESGPRLFAKPDDPESCPVADYKEYARRRPPGACHDLDPLYLVPRALCPAWPQAWYCQKALSRVKLEKLLKAIARQAKRPAKQPKK